MIKSYAGGGTTNTGVACFVSATLSRSCVVVASFGAAPGPRALSVPARVMVIWLAFTERERCREPALTEALRARGIGGGLPDRDWVGGCEGERRSCCPDGGGEDGSVDDAHESTRFGRAPARREMLIVRATEISTAALMMGSASSASSSAAAARSTEGERVWPL